MMTDTRRQILKTIHEQTKLLQAETLQPQLHIWTAQQWFESFQFLFVNCTPAVDTAHHDDLLFFVKSASHPTAKHPPFFVRRKAKQLPEELQLSGTQFGNVDWAQTVLLNIVLQSQYQLTVVACRHEALPFVAEGRTWCPDMIAVSKPVYASTTITAVNLDSSRAEASNPQPCYPDICFAVDNFDNAFEDLVLEDADKCYCVVLHAILGSYDHAAEPYPELGAEALHISSSKQASTSRQQQHPLDTVLGSGTGSTGIGTGIGDGRQAAGGDSAGAQPPSAVAVAAGGAGSREGSGAGASGSPMGWQIGTRRRTLFAGYVSYSQILDFLESSARSKSLLDTLMGSKAGQQDKVVMTGPGGVGRCEVAVTTLEQNSRSNSGTPSGSQHSGAASDAAAAAKLSSDGGNGGSSSSGGGSGSTAVHPQQQASIPQQQRQQPRGFLQRSLQQARTLASGVQQALSDINSGAACNMMCAMMLLKLPVSYLARELLDAV